MLSIRAVSWSAALESWKHQPRVWWRLVKLIMRCQGLPRWINGPARRIWEEGTSLYRRLVLTTSILVLCIGRRREGSRGFDLRIRIGCANGQGEAVRRQESRMHTQATWREAVQVNIGARSQTTCSLGMHQGRPPAAINCEVGACTDATHSISGEAYLD